MENQMTMTIEKKTEVILEFYADGRMMYLFTMGTDMPIDEARANSEEIIVQLTRSLIESGDVDATRFTAVEISFKEAK